MTKLEDLTIRERILLEQRRGGKADPLWKKDFVELLNSKRLLTDLELRLVATIAAFIRDRKV